MNVRNKKLEIFTNKQYDQFRENQTINGKNLAANFDTNNNSTESEIDAEAPKEVCPENKHKNLNQEVKEIINLIEEEKQKHKQERIKPRNEPVLPGYVQDYLKNECSVYSDQSIRDRPNITEEFEP